MLLNTNTPKPVDREKNQLNTLLYKAIKSQKINDVAMHIEAGAQLNVRAARCHFPLVMAAEKGDMQIVNLLIAKGADPNINKNFRSYGHGNIEGGKPLIQAIKNHHLSVVKLLLANGADPKTFDENGDSALINAVDWNGFFPTGSLETVKALVEAGADVNTENGKGMSALILQGRYFEEDTINYLLEHGAVLDLETSIKFGKNTRNEDWQAKLAAYVENYHLNKAASSVMPAVNELPIPPKKLRL